MDHSRHSKLRSISIFEKFSLSLPKDTPSLLLGHVFSRQKKSAVCTKIYCDRNDHYFQSRREHIFAVQMQARYAYSYRFQSAAALLAAAAVGPPSPCSYRNDAPRRHNPYTPSPEKRKKTLINQLDPSPVLIYTQQSSLNGMNALQYWRQGGRVRVNSNRKRAAAGPSCSVSVSVARLTTNYFSLLKSAPIRPKRSTTNVANWSAATA